MHRRLSTVLAACLLALAAGCKSNNADGRLVGRWVCTSIPSAPPGVNATMTWVFGADGSFSATVQAPGVSKTITGKYRTGFGDAVYMDHLSEQIDGKDIATDDITVNGNQLTARDPDGTTFTFTKQ